MDGPVAAGYAGSGSSEPLRTRPVGWGTLALFLAVATSVLVLLIVGRGAGPLAAWLGGPAWRANLSSFAILLMVVVGGVIFGVARLRPDELGMRRRGLAQAIAVTAGIWLAAQIGGAAVALVARGHIALEPSWADPGVGPTLLWAAAMFLGTAVYEEIAFRGFVYPQLYLKLPGTPAARLWLAMAGTELLFALSHIPGHLALRAEMGAGAIALRVLVQGLAGAVLLVVYLRTRNLWIAIGLHGLANAPTPLLASTLPWELFLVPLLLAWPRLTRTPSHRGLAAVLPVGGGEERTADPSGPRAVRSEVAAA